MLSVDGVSRRYGERTVLDEVSFEVRPGRLTGFVGANGAGKTTTMRIIVGVLAANGGQVLWGEKPIDTDVRRHIGYMPEERGLYPKMKVLDQLVYFGRLHGLSAADASRRATELLTKLGLEERLHDVLETLSLGNQQRVQIAAALVHRPTALVLDEPFSGLDPIAVDAMVGLLKDEVRPEMPVLFSSHQLDLVERICDDLVILSAGKLVASGSVEELRAADGDRFQVRLAGGAPTSTLSDVPGVELIESRNGTALIKADAAPEQVLADLLAYAPVAEFSRVQRPLSEIYREAVR
jgi:ABC-2 type transport system ATP-binding protein